MARRNIMLESSDIYLMRRDGETVAASNHGHSGTFVGQNFRYRPYFQDALMGHPARFYGVGTTSGSGATSSRRPCSIRRARLPACSRSRSASTGSRRLGAATNTASS
ncbi:hypothetical protein QWZ10_00350 [Paracoccus cavernae]|nr:hypothetical protein [Paracoccus cavernae]